MTAGAALRRSLVAAFARGLASVDLEERVAAAMPDVPRGVRAGVVVAVGKGAPAMARGALGAAGAWCTRALVVAPDGTEARLSDSRVELHRASHPDPDMRSVAAARRALEVVRAADFAVVLVSGGASSLVCLPAGVTLARYARLVRAMLLAGATVREVNVVRRHLCSLKGGGLARAARGPVWTLVASDVIGGAPCDVGSGPTVADPTTRAEARALLARFVPRLQAPPLVESLKSGASRGLHARVVARPEDLARAVARQLSTRFDRVRVLRPSLAPAAELAHEYVARARALRPGEALVRAAEPTVVVNAARRGRGGRSTHLASLVACDLAPGVALLAAASDGVDGASETGGAVVDASLRERATHAEVARAIARFDTGPLLAKAAMTLPGAPSGTNLADVHVLARAPR